MTQARNAIQQTVEDIPLSEAKQKNTPLHRLRSMRSIPPTWMLCLLIGGIASGFNLYRLGNPSIWFDEAWSVELSRLPLSQLWHIIFGPEPNMELYYLFLHGWLGFIALLGLHPTEFVVRLPSAVFAAGSSVALFLLGRRFLGVTAGLLGAGLYLLNDLQLVYAQQTRSYSMQLLLLCLAWYAFFAALSSESRRKYWWICYVVMMALAIYAQVFSFFILLAQVVAFAGLLFLPGPWRSSAWRQLLAMIVSLVAIIVMSIPLLLISGNGSRGSTWLPVPHPRDIYLLFLTISSNSKIYLLAIAACGFFGLLISILFYLPRGTQLLQRIAALKDSDNTSTSRWQLLLPIAFSLLCWLVVPIIASYVLSQGATRLFSSRYLLTIVPPIFLLVGLGVSLLRWRPVQLALALGLLLLALRYVPLYYQNAQIEDWNTATIWLEQHYQANDGLICYDNSQGCQISVEYYLHAYPSGAHFTPDSPGAYSWDNVVAIHSSAAVDPHALAAFAAKHPHIFFITGRLSGNTTVMRARAAEVWLDSHYRLVSLIMTPTVTVRLYATTIGGS